MSDLYTKPELLAPGGNPVKARTALIYGADAVYIGGKAFGLRANADNFTLDEIKELVAFADEKGKKVYVTLNILPRSHEIRPMCEYAKELENKLSVFRTVTKTKSAVHLIMLTSNGISTSKYSNIVMQSLTADCLFGV